MNFHIEPDQNNQIIQVKVTCLLNQGIRKEILLAIADQLKASEISRVIIDLTESTFNQKEEMVGALDLVNYMRSIGIQPHVKLAFIYSDAERHRKYFEDVAQLDGFNIRYFKTHSQVEEWLM